MSLAQILVLGLTQGATEFLPISSTAHLILLPWFFKFPDPGLIFDISLHLGTLLAVIFFFRKEWWNLIKNLKKNNLVVLLVFATIPGVILAVLFESWAETGLRSPFLIALSLAVFGIILWLVDTRVKHLNDLNHLNKSQAFFIGLWQALAIVPGVSRSGATISGGLLIGLRREAAVKFSFLLSAPIITGSVMVGLFKMVENGKWRMESGELILGTLTSFIAGMLAIKFLLKFIRTHSFLPFVVYRILLAVLILASIV